MFHKIATYAIFIPTIIGFIRYRCLDRSYRFFIAFLLIGCINELLQNFFYDENMFRAYCQITYALGEFILLSKTIQLWKGNMNPPYLFLVIVVSTVCFDAYVIPKLQYTLTITNSMEPTLLVMMSIPVLAKEFSKQKNQFFHSRIFILLPLLVTTVFDIVFNLALWFSYSKSTHQFFINYAYFLLLLQFLCYICFTFSLVWAPKKEEFLLL